MSSFAWQVYSPNSIPSYIPKSNGHGANGIVPSISQPSAASSKRGSVATEFSNSNDFITYIIPDFNAVRYFQKEFIKSGEFHLVEESEVTGFEIYLVDQWVNNRNIGTVVTVYTGNESKILVVRFTIIKKPSKYYPPRFQEYLNELIQNHSRMKKMENERRPRDASNEVCFVTNLTSLPSNLNLIPIPHGDVRKVESAFIINSNLRKLHCTGRSISLISEKISDASEGKFRQMYKIYNVPVKFASRELVNVVQTCLFYFDLLDARYCNGLLCAKTEEAINNWWNLVGLPHFNIKPNRKDGILPAMTVAAIISLILSVRLRIQIVGGSDVPKDPFDFENFMIAIGQFQRQYKLDKTRKLDMETLNRLFNITNARLLPEKHANYFYSSAYGDNSIYDSDYTYEFPSSPPQRKENLPKRYGKELKKLTNVVKTVQGHIASKADLDEIQTTPQNSTSRPTTGRIMNKIAKLADMSSPLDVETLDLEYLVKNYLTGKVLIRLFYGVQNGATADKLIEQTGLKEADHHHHHHHHMRRRGRSITDNTNTNSYVFESLRDKIANTQELALGDYRYSRGFNFKMFGLQSKRNLVPERKRTVVERTLEPSSRVDEPSTSLVDTFLQIGGGDTSSYAESIGSGKNNVVNGGGGGTGSLVYNSTTELNHPIVKFQRNLNRRNSFPFMLENEANLNSLVVSKVDTRINSEMVEIERKRPRSFSYSCVETVAPDPQISTVAKLSQRYLKNINKLMKYENLRKLYFEEKDKKEYVTNKSLEHSYQLMNLELVKLNNLRVQMDSHRAKIMDEGFADHLQYNMNLLTTTIDRLVYETRIVVKRIDELEDNYQFFEMKNDDTQKKMTKVIDNLIRSTKFKLVYPDPQERKRIIVKLVGEDDERYIQQGTVDYSRGGGLKIYFMMIFEFVWTYFQIFRANMNADRIRAAWGKLDPNRTIINKAYSYMHRQPVQASQTTEVREELD
ncbi:uncharacterized protein SPAPADRAFT_154850 [Spathaspora passalidarum NRRL Y-27907]|uniref:STB6-like N-terminal domain-containing protein n=1 Tax=Spathaspora passalidarum (strain NRRL Y-27907 / 11-Y1) TaxID=619300 RepID=G3AQJ5_SPAPN|nr:uncharacterized protein SPAPADRAFT_154850 [Spathaspora passalidarum NRRL Y-27907]EGW31542.1 hypothetical protein SPAPADRAFT_154850 [Spathaspora passalidarum NRRL Y-27907]